MLFEPEQQQQQQRHQQIATQIKRGDAHSGFLAYL